MKRAIIDTETYRIGPGQVIPKLVCATFRTAGKSKLLSTADAGIEAMFDEWFTPGNGLLLAFHNAGFDIPVIYRAFPRLQTKIWDKLEAGECTCTMLREQLLNLATHGKLDMFTKPDGSTTRLLYGLDALILAYRGIDISDSKKGEDAWRQNFALLEGLPAASYPPAAAEYVRLDGVYTDDIFEDQDARAASADNPEAAIGNLNAAPFHVAAAVALAFVTERGMATDEAEFNKLCASLDAELSDDKMRPLISAEIMEPATPPLPYKQHEKKAREILAEWLDVLPEDVDFSRIDEGLLQSLQDAGVKVKAPTKSSIKTKQLKRYVVAAMIAKQTNRDMDEILKKCASVDAAMAEAMTHNVTIAKTDGDDVSTAGEVIAEVAGVHPVLKTYQHRQKLQKLVSTEIPRMMWDGKLSPVVHFPFKTLLETGRTSSGATDKYPSANGQNVDPRARRVYVPRPGYVLCSCDFSALELVCVAQTTYDMFGESVHRDKIIAGYDLHGYLGARLAIELGSVEFLAVLQSRSVLAHDIDAVYQVFKSMEFGPTPERKKLYKFWRKLAKPVGLGFPSGLGAITMVELAMKEPYSIDMIGLAGERYKTHENEFDLTSVIYAGRKLHGMTKETIQWTPMLKAVAFATRLRGIWLGVYPEMERYFKAVREMTDSSGDCYFMDPKKRELFEEHTAIWHEMDEETRLGEPAPDPADYGGTSLLCYTTPLGMHRARCTYTAVSNGLCMQSPGAEGAKAATIRAVRSSIDPSSQTPLSNGGGFVVDFVHDELLVEIREDEFMHERAQEVRRCMEVGLQRVIRDVPVKAQPVLMRKWDKDAQERLDANGRLLVWEPDPAPVAVSA